MMLRRISLIWIGSVCAWAGLVFGYSRRRFLFDSDSESSLVEGNWSFRWDLFSWGALGLTLVCIVLFMQGTLSVINQKRARQGFPNDRSVVILGVRNFHRSLVSGGPLAEARGLGHFSTVLVASERGIRLMGGVFKLESRWELSWAGVEEVVLFTLTAQSHHVAGVGVSIRVKNFAIPLEFALVSSRFPWVDVASEPEVRLAIDQLRTLRNGPSQ